MDELIDAELVLRASRGSREALGAIARRYVGFVYAAAMRQVREPHLAEDVTQTVFLILCGKVHRMNPNTLLHAWLFTTTRYVAANAAKVRRRRMHHERNVAKMSGEPVEPILQTPDEQDILSPLLDSALASLGERDRSAVLLSFFARKSWREVGEAIGSSEEAARKRVERAVVQMRRFFIRRGVSASAAAVASGLASAAGAAAPARVVESVACAVASPATIVGTTVGAATGKGAIAMLVTTNAKLAASFAAGLLLAIGVAGAMVMRAATGETSTQAQSPARAPAPAAGEDASHSVQLKNGIEVQLVGVVHFPPKRTSWDGRGQPHAEMIELPEVQLGTVHPPAAQVVARIRGVNDDTGVEWKVFPPGASMAVNPAEEDGGLTAITIHLPDARKTTDLVLRMAAGDWPTLAVRQGNGLIVMNNVIFGEIYDVGDGHCGTTVTESMLDHQVRVIAIDLGGQEYVSGPRLSGSAEGFRQATYHFPVPTEEIDRMEFQSRPFDQRVEFKNIALQPNLNSKFEAIAHEPEP